MKNSIVLILLLYTYHPAPAQPRIGGEQYYCPGSPAATATITRLYYQSATRNYVEARYNYDAEATMGLSVGRVFGGGGKRASWRCTPTAGIVAGRCLGFSLGLNAGVDFDKWNLSSSAQLTPGKGEGYFYSWSEIGRSIGERFYAGTALQQDFRFGTGVQWSPGLTVQVSIGEWTVPVYVFESFGKQVWLLAGITRQWTLHKHIDHIKTPSITP